ncbi:MAG TPA: ferrous iron transporter B [Vicinamibacterales bacterium]|nr:ferrous iron transporter B [Vicinamibacterales bacterium]
MACPAQSASRPSTLLHLRAHPRRVLLVGNANVGKSVIFGRLTGRYATVSNFPGTTVAVTRGHVTIAGEVCELIDTPGVNTLDGALSEDEAITRRLLVGGDIDLIVQVADARNLRRALMLTSQLGAFGRPMILVLNMVDEARDSGIDINSGALSEATGIPVVETVAVEGRGLSELRQAVGRAGPLVLGKDGLQPAAVWAAGATARFMLRRPTAGHRIQETIARWTRQPATAIPLLAAVLYFVYLFVGVFGAQTLVGLVEEDVFGRWINPAATALATRLLPWAFARDFFVGEYGLITMGLTYAIAIVLPVVSTFFLIFGVLEDSGYLPRLAIFSDRIFRSMGLNGRAVLPMVLGLGCDTMATMTTRILATPKERLIAILLLALGIPCSAQLATIMGILGGISFAALVTLFGVVLTQMFVVGFLAARVLTGERSPFILELPPIRVPRLDNLITKTWLRVKWYLGEAVPLFLLGTVLLFVLDRTGALVWITRGLEPLVVGMLGLPRDLAKVFIMGFLRRDYGAAGLFMLADQGRLTGVQSVVALTVMTLFMPCVANFLMIVKERGAKVAFTLLAVITPIAVFTGAALNVVLRAVHVSF